MPIATTRTGFATDGIVNPQIAKTVLNKLVGGAPFARSLTRFNTGNNSVTFPLAGPTGAAWTDEGDALPEMTLGDESYHVIPTKIGGVYALSNEMVDDTDFDITAALNAVIADTISHDLDLGLLDGDGTGATPNGIIAAATETTGADLVTAAVTAAGEIGDAGGAASHIALKPSAYAAEILRLGTAPGGSVIPPHPLYGQADGGGDARPAANFLTIGGLIPVQVPGISQPVVYDGTRVLFVVRSDFQVAVNPYILFAEDSLSVRIRGRFSIAFPVVDKAVRKLTIA